MSPPLNRRIDNVISDGGHSRTASASSRRKTVVSLNDAYLFALRVAYLAYLLGPRARRTQHVPAPQQNLARSGTSIHELMKDFSILRDSKTTRFPSRFMAALEKRVGEVLMGRERSPEYHDAAVKRTFGASLNAFMEPGFRRRMEKDRRVEDLVLIFLSNATKELQKGKPPSDQSWKMLADRHLALFVRLVNSILRDEDWAKERPELASRLATLESKLLKNDQDLSAGATTTDGAGTTVEVLVPLSYEVKDMPLVQVVARIFGLTNTMAQSDLDRHRSEWTLEAALRDVKTYQTLLSINSKRTLTADDFDSEEAYDAWKKGEAPALSQMILAIVQADPELARSTSVHSNAASGPVPLASEASSSVHADASRRMVEDANASPHVVDHPVDVSAVSPTSDEGRDPFRAEDYAFAFIPPDPRAYYRAVLAQALAFDLKDDALQRSEGAPETPAIKLLSRQSTELLNELCLRWRVPYVSRAVLFLDVIRERFIDSEISLDTLDAAFGLVKDPPPENKRNSGVAKSLLLDRTRWTLADFSLNQQILLALHKNLLRDLLQVMVQCYEPKPPSPGAILYVIESHIENDPSFPEASENLTEFANDLREGLRGQAFAIYKGFLDKHLPQDQEQWEFLHVIDLGKAVTSLAQRIQKRYRKNPEIKGVNPLSTLVETMLPLYAEDARDIVARILQLAKSRNEEVPVEDGFDLYGELVEIRRIHSEALPSVEFAFKIEDLLADFVWRWIKTTESMIATWIDGAVRHDEFQVRSPPGATPTEDERHSVSVIDIFSSFNQTISKIVQLNWDNDLHYAKFMTSLSRIVGIGISRYCDILQERFNKEMDRLTPEQEAAANQSRQEKWMQMAKDAWNNRDKIEPFNFFPESFVKLNNIDFATVQLDRLEQEVKVDACAEIIEKNTPPLNYRQRKITKYVFTIKIVEAEDLKACDSNGLSDPYVVLGDEYQKRLAKTRIVYANLNPRWDETVDITTQGPLNIVATVWDWDTLGDHDCVGRTSIKLDPSHFGDFLPREYWLDLDTQGRLLLRVSMEGERDDIQFYFGKAFRTLKRTERDMTRTITDKLSAYINHCLSRRGLRSLFSKGLSMSSVSSYFNRNKAQPVSAAPTQAEITDALKPLLTYFDDNFAIMNQTLTNASMVSVMSRLWKEVLAAIEALVVPPLSDKISAQRPLSQQELDIVFKWLQLLFDFFHARDEETGEANGVPLDVLQSPKYHDLKTLNFFYFESTDSLVRTSERMASANAARQQTVRNRLSAPAGFQSMSFGGAAGMLGVPSRKNKSVMLSRNLGTMKKAKEEKRKEAQADPNDDMILRILRMRPEAERYLKDRSRQKERLAAAAAAELIVRQSIAQGGGGRMMSNLPRR